MPQYLTEFQSDFFQLWIKERETYRERIEFKHKTHKSSTSFFLCVLCWHTGTHSGDIISDLNLLNRLCWTSLQFWVQFYCGNLHEIDDQGSDVKQQISCRSAGSLLWNIPPRHPWALAVKQNMPFLSQICSWSCLTSEPWSCEGIVGLQNSLALFCGKSVNVDFLLCQQDLYNFWWTQPLLSLTHFLTRFDNPDLNSRSWGCWKGKTASCIVQ